MNISYEELLTEIDKYSRHKFTGFTDEQLEVLKKARERNVSWDNILMLWEKAGWGKFSRSMFIRKARESGIE